MLARHPPGMWRAWKDPSSAEALSAQASFSRFNVLLADAVFAQVTSATKHDQNTAPPVPRRGKGEDS